MRELRKNKGFTLIELLIVVAIIGILSAIAIPGYLGMQERGRKGAVQRSAASALPEFQTWMNSAKKGSLPAGQGALTEIDFNCNGTVEAFETNNALSIAGVITSWITCRNITLSEQSPWGGIPLWNNAGVAANLPTCEGLATAGQITLCYTPAEDFSIQRIFVVARDITGTTLGTVGGGNIFFSKTVSSD